MIINYLKSMNLEQIYFFLQHKTAKIFVFVFSTILSTIIVYYLHLKGTKDVLQYEFSDRINNKYITKASLYIEIKKNKYDMYEYHLDFFEKNLQIGDSLVKKKGDFKVEVYRKDSTGQYQFIGNWTNY
jgi:hypothetical protein